jgi:hypothetical protein
MFDILKSKKITREGKINKLVNSKVNPSLQNMYPIINISLSYNLMEHYAIQIFGEKKRGEGGYYKF